MTPHELQSLNRDWPTSRFVLLYQDSASTHCFREEEPKSGKGQCVDEMRIIDIGGILHLIEFTIENKSFKKTVLYYSIKYSKKPIFKNSNYIYNVILITNRFFAALNIVEATLNASFF